MYSGAERGVRWDFCKWSIAGPRNPTLEKDGVKRGYFLFSSDSMSSLLQLFAAISFLASLSSVVRAVGFAYAWAVS